MSIELGFVKIIDANGTYLINGSLLPLFLDDNGVGYCIEEYEKGNPCTHFISDLICDDVKLEIVK